MITSAVYLTIDNGVWKDSETTGQLYENIRNKIKPYMKPIVEQIPFELPELPKTGDIVSTAKTTWNKGVMASCLFLIELPELSWEYIKKGSMFTYSKISEEIKALNNMEAKESNKSKSLTN